jgi:hypothetical protein
MTQPHTTTPRDIQRAAVGGLLEAIEYAGWFALYALDRLPDRPDAHPGIHGHLNAARVQLEAALSLAADSQEQQRAA